MNTINYKNHGWINSHITEVQSPKLFRFSFLFKTTTSSTKSVDSANFIQVNNIARIILSISFIAAILILFWPASVHADDKTLIVADLKLQGLSIGITEDEAKRIIIQKGYSLMTSSTYGNGYTKEISGGGRNSIYYYVAVPGAQEAEYRRIIRITYNQLFSKTAIFDIKQVYLDLQKKLGQADESSFHTSKKSVASDSDSFKLRYYDDDQQQAPMLWLEGALFFTQGSLSAETFWNGLKDELNKKYRAQMQKKEILHEQEKGKAIIDF